MKITEIVNKLHLTVFSGENGLSRDVKGAYVSDLLSDVMGNAREGQIWITLQNHKNVLAVGSLKELAGIILVRGIKPDQDTMIKSDEEGIPLLGTDKDTFNIAGDLFEILNVK